jgi:hypothetical protein
MSTEVMTPDMIEAEHDRLGYTLGWRFMMAPERNLVSSEVAIIALNPGGTRRHGPSWSQEDGNAYVVESWGGKSAGSDPLQRQIQRMCQVLTIDPGRTFTSQYVPFRSNAWSELPRQKEALAFARRLWVWALAQSKARTLICVGKNIVAPDIAQLIGAHYVDAVPAGWGDQTIARYRTADGRLVLGLPHLGRFGLFNRAVSEKAFDQALN